MAATATAVAVARTFRSHFARSHNRCSLARIRIYGQACFFTTSGTELFSQDVELAPVAARIKARSKAKRKEKKVAAVANAATAATADNLRLQGLLAHAQIELRHVRHALATKEGEHLSVKASLDQERAAHEQTVRQQRARYDQVCLHLRVAQDALKRRVEFDRSHEDSTRKASEDLLKSVEWEHEQYVRSVKRRHDEDLCTARLEKDAVIESLRKQLATSEQTLARVRTERDESKHAYFRYKSKVKQLTEQGHPEDLESPRPREVEGSPAPLRRVLPLDAPASPGDPF